MANSKGSGVNRMIKGVLTETKTKGEAFKKQMYAAFDAAGKMAPKGVMPKSKNK